MLPELGDLTKPLLFKGEFKNLIKFGWSDCETAINQSIYLKNIETINFDGRKQVLDITTKWWHGNCFNIFQIANHIDVGYSFVLTHMGGYNESINHLCSFIEEKYSTCSDVHIYGGLFSNSKSFGPHSDKPHNLIIQLDGTCRWIVYSEIFKNTGPFDPDTNLTPIIDCILEPGDGIFIPPFQVHSCIPLSKRLSASVAFHPNHMDQLKRGWIKIGD